VEVVMTTKLTLTLEKEVIEKTKIYAKNRKDQSFTHGGKLF
jgi:hypothetical protein